MAPALMEYQTTECYTHKKFNTASYRHKKFDKRDNENKQSVIITAPLFRPYALNDNTPRKRRMEMTQLPPTPPTTPPQMMMMPPPPPPAPRSSYSHPGVTYIPPPVFSVPAPSINHQAFAVMLQKQRTVLQMRQLLAINPDANTWPVEWRNALYTMLQS